MKKKFLGLGSNIGDRRANLELAVKKLNETCDILRVSPVYETPALTSSLTGENWDQPFLNLAVQIETDKPPLDFLRQTQRIEKLLGRDSSESWAPRTIDIDILLWGDAKINSDNLKVPHPAMYQRSFVLDPMSNLDPSFLRQARSHPQHSPLLMAILNLTPDSFSNGSDKLDLKQTSSLFNHYKDLGVHIVDIGAESTRPGARRLSEEVEWQRLEPILELWRQTFERSTLRPALSIDTYKANIAERAIERGAEIINDVSGLRDPAMVEILKNSDVSYVLTHSLDVPANPKNTIPHPTIQNMCQWLDHKIEILEKNSISLDRVYFDPGIGFGKSSYQSIEILRNLSELQKYPFLILIGHSRKSFMKSFSQGLPLNRDIETLGISLELIAKGVDVLRVHNPELHIRAMRARQYVVC